MVDDPSPAVPPRIDEGYKGEPAETIKCQDVCEDKGAGNQGTGDRRDSNQHKGTQGKNVSMAYNDTILPSDLDEIFKFIDRVVIPRAAQQPLYDRGCRHYAPHSLYSLDVELLDN